MQDLPAPLLTADGTGLAPPSVLEKAYSSGLTQLRMPERANSSQVTVNAARTRIKELVYSHAAWNEDIPLRVSD